MEQECLKSVSERRQRDVWCTQLRGRLFHTRGPWTAKLRSTRSLFWCVEQSISRSARIEDAGWWLLTMVICCIVSEIRRDIGWKSWFLSRVTMTRDVDIAILSVCPFVCPWRSGIRWKRFNISSYFFSPYGSPIILVLSASNIFTKFQRGHSVRGR